MIEVQAVESIGRYKTLRKIGSGGMAEVFLARSRGAQGTEKLLVIKKIHPALSLNSKFIEMFVDEAHVAMRLNHTNIVQVYSFDHYEDTYLLAMEYVDGADLLRLEKLVLGKNERFPFGVAAYIVAEIAKGLDYAHSRCDDNGVPLEIVHRDVSPQNILISMDGATKIADFGIARARSLHEDSPGAIKGKFGYMSPEQAQGLKVDRRTDIYALGVVLYELLIGRPLLRFDNGEDPRAVICDTRHPAPREIDPAIPVALSAVVAKAVSHNPDDRFDSARDMARELGQYLHSEQEIYDEQALEAFMAPFAPELQIPLPESDDDFDDEPTRVGTTREHRLSDPDTLGLTEQRATIVVTGRFEIDLHPTRGEINNKLMRLVNEMAFKSDGVLRKYPDYFAIYLGLVHSAMEDSIQAVRLAYDVLDAARAVERDSGVKIRTRLAVCQGIVHAQGGSQQAAQTFEPDPKLTDKCRQMTAASNEGEILSDGQIFKLVRREYNFEDASADAAVDDAPSPPHGPLQMLYRISGTRTRKERREKIAEQGRFYGRGAELGKLRAAFEQARDRHPVFLKVSGEMGIGKTRLVEQVLEDFEAQDVAVLNVECLFVERDCPMAVAAAAIRAALDLGDAEMGEGESKRRLGRHLKALLGDAPRYLERQRRFFEEFLHAPDAVWEKNPANRRTLVQRVAYGLGVILSLLTKERPFAIVVENAQWLDSASIDVLSELSHEPPDIPIIVLLVGQPTTLQGRRIVNLEAIEVSEMDDDAIRGIILERLGTTESMKAIAEQIIRRAHGNPFFANEIVDSLIEQKIVVSTETGFRQDRPGTIRLPATMEGIALSRIAALPPSQRTVLRAASATGASFDQQTVGMLVGREVREDMEALKAAGLLVEMHGSSSKNPTYRFLQPMVREAAYLGLEKKDRQRIHRTIARRLIDASKKGDAIPDVRVAWHLERSGETEAAGARYVKAANAAAARYSDREALKLYDRAIPLIRSNSREKFQALAQREQVLRYLGRFDERERETAEMKRIAVLLYDDVLIAEALMRQAQLKYDLGDYDRAARILTESLEIAKRSEDETMQVESLRLLAFVAIQWGHLFRAVDCANRALAAVRSTNEHSFYLKALALDVKGFALMQMGHLGDAAAPLAEGLVLFRRLRQHRSESQATLHMALLARARGEIAEALEFLERAQRIDRKIRATRPRGLKLAAMAAIRADVGDFEGARANLSDAERICRENQERVGLAEVDLITAQLNIIEGQYGLALEILESLGRRAVVSQSRILLVWHRQLTVKALLGEGRAAAAQKLADEAARIALEAGMNGEAVHGGALQGLVLAEAGLEREAASATTRATDMLTMLGRVRNAEEVWWHQALTYHKIGDTFSAKRALIEAQQQVARTRKRLKDPRLQELYDRHPMVRGVERGFTSTK